MTDFTPFSVRDSLGCLLEDLVGSALGLLKRLGHITDFKDLRPTVSQYAHKARVNKFPDWWVLLVNGTEVEIEVKNLSKRPKDYVKSPTDTPFWAYDYGWVLEHMTKTWTKGAKKMLVISTMEVFSPGATKVLRTHSDGIVEASIDPHKDRGQIVEASETVRDNVAVDLYHYFERWMGAKL